MDNYSELEGIGKNSLTRRLCLKQFIISEWFIGKKNEKGLEIFMKKKDSLQNILNII